MIIAAKLLNKIGQKKIQILEIQNSKNTPLIPVCKYVKSTPWAVLQAAEVYIILAAGSGTGWLCRPCHSSMYPTLY